MPCSSMWILPSQLVALVTTGKTPSYNPRRRSSYSLQRTAMRWTRLIFVLIAALVATAQSNPPSSGPPGTATATQAPDQLIEQNQQLELQQLTDKLQRLEREVQELKGQIGAVQQSQKAGAECVTPAPEIQVTEETP